MHTHQTSRRPAGAAIAPRQTRALGIARRRQADPRASRFHGSAIQKRFQCLRLNSIEVRMRATEELTRELEELRGLNCACREDDLLRDNDPVHAPTRSEFDAGGGKPRAEARLREDDLCGLFLRSLDLVREKEALGWRTWAFVRT